MKFLLKTFLILISFILLMIVSLLLYSHITEFTPSEKTIIYTNNDSTILNDSIFTILTWNIGFAGLGKDMSFFYDGGEHAIPQKDWHETYLDGINEFLKSQEKETNFFILQEVDNGSKRSYYSNQKEILSQIEEHASYAKNYDVQFIPSPPLSPLGRTQSGILNLSDYTSKEATRYQYPSSYSWPSYLFFLKRCFLAEHYTLKNNKELVIINTHNSAYDDGSLKKNEMAYLRTFALSEYNKGNYVVIGGDFNQSPPGAKGNQVSVNYIPNWQWVFDDKLETCRALSEVYSPTTKKYIIDFFLVSPNVKPLGIKGIDLGFKYSDHQPVKMSFQLVSS